MTQEGRVEDFWTTTRRNRTDGDNVRPLLKALAAARRGLVDDYAQKSDPSGSAEATVLDLRRQSRRQPWTDTAIEFVPQANDPEAAEVAKAANVAVAADSVAAAAQAAAAASAAVTRAIADRTAKTEWMVVESEPPTVASQPVIQETVEDHPAPEWGDLWRNSVQGWVRQADGTKVWRPIVTTTTSVPNWEIDTNLGMVTGESACALDANGLGAIIQSEAGKDSLTKTLEQDRAAAQAAMVSEAVARGAHAVIGVKLDYTFLGECLIVTSTGTAVTLRTPA
ncbi:MAG: YbjQ family protein [Acidimicrobiia bacterium]|nr:YbjQ family protein [Acidimicrobiia bacterium]